MKMYIVVKRSIPDNLVPVVTAHSSLACYKKFETESDMQEWMSGIFRKVICVVSDEDFESLKLVEKNIILTESALQNQEVAIAFCLVWNTPSNLEIFPCGLQFLSRI